MFISKVARGYIKIGVAWVVCVGLIDMFVEQTLKSFAYEVKRNLNAHFKIYWEKRF